MKIVLSKEDDIDYEGKKRGGMRIEVESEAIDEIMKIDMGQLNRTKSIKEQIKDDIHVPRSKKTKSEKLKQFGYKDEDTKIIADKLKWR